MKILLIDIEKGKIEKEKNTSATSLNINLLQNFTEPLDDIKTVTSYDSAHNFIDKKLIDEKKYIDFILIHVKSDDSKKANEFALDIRKSNDTYFNGYFKVSAICIVLLTNYTFYENVIESHLYSRVIYSYWEESHLIRELGLAITDWRQKLAGELDELNIKLDVDFKDFNPKWALRYKLHKLNILTSKFINDQNRFSFLWLGDKLQLIDYSVNEFQGLLKSRIRYKEKRIHEYLMQNERILLGEYKSGYIYEKHLYYQGSKKYIEGDFINYSHNYYFENPEVFEVKRPEKKVVKKDNRGVYSHFNRYLNQVSKYHSYLTDQKNVKEIESKLDIRYQNFDYTMLFSRSEYVDDYIGLINNKIDILPFKMKLITYDELINRFERFYERTKKFGVR